MLAATEMAPSPMLARSSLEVMLETIRIRDERPEGAPPALPSRPTSRGRLPSPRRPVPFKPGSVVSEVLPKMAAMPGSQINKENGPATPLLGLCGKIAAGKDTRIRNLQSIVSLQKRFRGHQARCSFEELKQGVTTLQSFVRGERTRYGFEYISKRWKAAVLIQNYVKGWIAKKQFDEQRKDILLVQSVIRAWLVRRRSKVLRNLESPKPNKVKVNNYQSKHVEEKRDVGREHLQVHPSVLEELQRRVLQAEAALRHEEEENLMLQQRFLQYETRWSEYEAKMKSMEQTWKTQLTSLQVSLGAQSIFADDIATRPRKLDVSSDDLYFDSEDTMSFETHSLESTPTNRHTPEGTLARQTRHSGAILSKNYDGTRKAVSHLVQEFEQRSRAFEDNAGFLMGVRSGSSDSITSQNEELRQLKVRFDAWTKDYNVRLQETKAALQKHEPKARKRWWTPSCTR